MLCMPRTRGTIPSDVQKALSPLMCHVLSSDASGPSAHMPQQPLVTSWLSPITQVAACDQQVQA